MQFAHAEHLNWLWSLFIIGALFFLALKNRESMLGRFAQAKLIPEIAPTYLKSRHVLKMCLVAGVVLLSTIALARPQWGFEWQEVKQRGLDIVIVVDTSKSMLTQDIKPNRLERTKLAVQDFLRKLKGDRVGLIAFAGDAFAVCPLTVDYNGFLLSLNDLDAEIIPRGGTNLAQAIEEAIKEYDQTPSKYKAVIVLTDGENLEADPYKSARGAKEKGIKIYAVGIGTREGELIEIKNIVGEKEFLKDNNGNFVKSRLNEKILQDIALLTGGIYVRASGAEFGLDLIYDREISKLEKREVESKMKKKYYERFQWPLGLAVFLLIFDACLTTGVDRRES